jgi:hypothetical protein
VLEGGSERLELGFAHPQNALPDGATHALMADDPDDDPDTDESREDDGFRGRTSSDGRPSLDPVRARKTTSLCWRS